MSNTKVINHVTEDGTWEEKKIYEVVEKDSSKYFLLGSATGINMDHCVMLGAKHKEDFWRCVYGYRIIPNEKMEKMMFESMKKIKPEIESYITVNFYERQYLRE